MTSMNRRDIGRAVLASALVPLSAVAAEEDHRMAIDDGLFVDINDMPQWITLRGQDLRNPVLLWLHGGPGFPMSGMAPAFADWERHFTLVQWDQPGGGATHAKNLAQGEGPLTLERFVKDGFAVVDYVRGRLGAEKVVLMGVSWGTLLGSVMVHQRPELFSAYVGLSQAISGPRGDQLSYQLGLQAARARGDSKAVEDLTRVGPPPYKRFEDFLILKQYTNAPGLPPSPEEAALGAGLLRVMTTPPPADARYVARGLPATDFIQVFMEAQRQANPILAGWEIGDLGRAFHAPIVLVEGELDFNTPTALAKDWLDGISAPAKAMEVIPGAGHGALAFHDEILKILLRRVLPLIGHA